MTADLEIQGDQDYLRVPVESPPGRIVSLVPSMTESLLELNMGERVVGRTSDCIYPVNRVTSVLSVGSARVPDVAAIVALRPDLVIANQEVNRLEDIEALKTSGVPVWVTFPKSIPDVFNMLWNLMYACDETSMVPRVRLMEYTYDWVLGTTKAQEDRICRVFAPLSIEPLVTFNGDTYSHDLLAVCGGTNVFADCQDRYPGVGWEAVEAAQPDVILLPTEIGGSGLSIQELDVPAVKHNRIYRIEGRLLSWHGIRLAFALEVIPPLLDPGMATSNDSEISGAE